MLRRFSISTPIIKKSSSSSSSSFLASFCSSSFRFCTSTTTTTTVKSEPTSTRSNNNNSNSNNSNSNIVADGVIDIVDVDFRWSSIRSTLGTLGNVTETYELRPYHDTGDAYLDMWKAVDNAKSYIIWHTYIAKDDKIGKITIDKLVAAVKRGVQVEFLYDCGGNMTGREQMVKPLIEVGAKVIRFRPFFPGFGIYFTKFHWHFSPAVRNHRKILVVDDVVGFTGGLNIGCEYAGERAGGTGKFRDSHCRVTGADGVRMLKLACTDTMSPRPGPIARALRWRQWAARYVQIRRSAALFASSSSSSKNNDFSNNNNINENGTSSSYSSFFSSLVYSYYSYFGPFLQKHSSFSSENSSQSQEEKKDSSIEIDHNDSCSKSKTRISSLKKFVENKNIIKKKNSTNSSSSSSIKQFWERKRNEMKQSLSNGNNDHEISTNSTNEKTNNNKFQKLRTQLRQRFLVLSKRTILRKRASFGRASSLKVAWARLRSRFVVVPPATTTATSATVDSGTSNENNTKNIKNNMKRRQQRLLSELRNRVSKFNNNSTTKKSLDQQQKQEGEEEKLTSTTSSTTSNSNWKTRRDQFQEATVALLHRRRNALLKFQARMKNSMLKNSSSSSSSSLSASLSAATKSNIITKTLGSKLKTLDTTFHQRQQDSNSSSTTFDVNVSPNPSLFRHTNDNNTIQQNKYDELSVEKSQQGILKVVHHHHHNHRNNNNNNKENENEEDEEEEDKKENVSIVRVPDAHNILRTLAIDPKSCFAQVLLANPLSENWSLQMALWFVARRAAARLWVTTPYYLPHRKLVNATIEAARRGVDVRILTGSRNTTDPWFMWYAQQYLSHRLLKAGVKLYEYHGGAVMHAKTVVVDGVWSSVGSYNWDILSNKLMEISVTALDPKVAATMERHFEIDLSKSEHVVEDTFLQRSFLVRLACRFFYYGLKLAEWCSFLGYGDRDLKS